MKTLAKNTTSYEETEAIFCFQTKLWKKKLKDECKTHF